MKKLMTLMLGLSLLAGFVTVSFAQLPKNETGKKGGKKGKKKKSDAPKKDGGGSY